MLQPPGALVSSAGLLNEHAVLEQKLSRPIEINATVGAELRSKEREIQLLQQVVTSPPGARLTRGESNGEGAGDRRSRGLLAEGSGDNWGGVGDGCLELVPVRSEHSIEVV